MNNNEQEQARAVSFTRRNFIRQAVTLALGGTATVTWLAACSSQPSVTPIAATVTPAPTVAPTTAPIPATATTAVIPTTGATAITLPTATVVLPTATATPPPSLKFVVFGDIRTAGLKPPPIFNKLRDLAKERKPEAAVLMGDIINADDDNKVVGQQWANLLDAFKPLGNIPLIPTMGNHETNGRKAALPLYAQAFSALPKNGPKELLSYVYSMEVTPIHFVSLASELPGQFGFIDDSQLDWLEKDLAANKQPYTIVLAHDPAFPAGPYLGLSLDSNIKQRNKFWSILTKYKVAAYISGHEHLYKRKEPEGGVMHLTIGTSGSSPYGGFGGDYYHYGFFETTPTGLVGRIFDETDKQRDEFILKPAL